MPGMLEPLESRRMFATVPAGFTDAAFGANTTLGTAMAFAPDGRLFVLRQSGQVNIIHRDGSTVASALSLTVNNNGERGLIGVAIDPNYLSNGYIYLYSTELPAGQSSTTYAGPTVNTVARFTVNGDTIDAASRLEILRLDPLSTATNHNGGSMNFGPDGKLYVGVGENANGANAQSITTRLGKMLRINSDGTIPADNPSSFPGIAGTTSGLNKAIWAVGLRNPFTFTFDPANGRMFINDVGQNTWEEINDGIAGSNYGWSVTEGDFNQASFPNYRRPLYSYQHTSTTFPFGYAIVGGAFYPAGGGNAFPSSYNGKYLFGDLAGWMAVNDPNNFPAPNGIASAFATGTSQAVDIDVGPDGSIYYLQRSGTTGVRRISVTTDITAPTASAGAFLFDAPSPRVRFAVNESIVASLTTADIEVRNIETDSVLPTSAYAVAQDPFTNFVNVTFTTALADGNYRVTLKRSGVTDGSGNLLSADASTTFFSLQADADRSRGVDTVDFAILVSNFGAGPKTFSQGDFNYDGIVSSIDFGIFVAQFGHAVAPGSLPRSMFGPAPATAGTNDALLDELR